MLQGALDAAESLEAPIIIGTAEVLLPYGELSLIAPSVVTAAKQASISCCGPLRSWPYF
jgi:fructose-bisphosphate aldolase class II